MGFDMQGLLIKGRSAIVCYIVYEPLETIKRDIDMTMGGQPSFLEITLDGLLLKVMRDSRASYSRCLSPRVTSADGEKCESRM